MSTFIFKNLCWLFNKYAVARTEHNILVKTTMKIFSNFLAFSENPNCTKSITFPQKLTCLKVRQSPNDFFKQTFLPKNERMNSTSQFCYLFLFVFWKKMKMPKKHFEINWSLGNSRNVGEIYKSDQRSWIRDVNES